MPLLDTIERVHRIHKLIQRRSTGTPDEFAEKLHLKKRQLYNILDELRSNGASIKYSRIDNTFYYGNDFEMSVTFKANN